MFFTGFVSIPFVDSLVSVTFKEVTEYSKHSLLEQTGMKFELKGVKSICEPYCGSTGANRIYTVCNRTVKTKRPLKIFR